MEKLCIVHILYIGQSVVCLIFILSREDQVEVLAEALKIMLCEGRQHDMQRAAAFIKRLATFSLCYGSAEALAGMFYMPFSYMVFFFFFHGCENIFSFHVLIMEACFFSCFMKQKILHSLMGFWLTSRHHDHQSIVRTVLGSATSILFLHFDLS